MESSFAALGKKGNLAVVPELYNPHKTYDKVVHFTPHLGDLDYRQLFAQWNITLRCFGVSRLSPVDILKGFLKILHGLHKEKVNVIRGRSPYLSSLLGCLAGRILGISSVVSLGGNNRLNQELKNTYKYGSKSWSYRIEKWVLQLCTKIIVPNRYTLQYVEGIIGKTAHKKCVVIPWIVEAIPEQDQSEPDIRSMFNIPQNGRIVCTIGHLNRYKYSDVLFQMLKKANWENEDVYFVFCGDGVLRKEGEGMLAGRNWIRFIGWQDRPVVHALLRQSDVVVIPMSGFVLLEAASLGKPVVTSNVEWHSELVRHEQEGLLAQADSPDEWLNGIDRMLHSPHQADKWGKALKTKFTEQYHPSITKEKELELVYSCANTP